MAHFIEEEFINEVLSDFQAYSEYRATVNACGFRGHFYFTAIHIFN